MAQEINGAPGQRTAQRSGLRKPSAPIGVLTSRHKKELRNTLASAGAREPIFSACRKPRPQDSVCFAGRASRPQAPHPGPTLRALVPTTPGSATLALAQVPHRRCEHCRRSPISARPELWVGGGKVRAANSYGSVGAVFSVPGTHRTPQRTTNRDRHERS